MRKGFTSKPCEGCGSTRGRQVGKVCHDCETLLNEARERREALKATPTLAAFFHAPVRHWNPIYYPPGGALNDALQQAFVDLIWLVSEPAPKDGTHYSGKWQYVLRQDSQHESGAERRLMREDVRNALHTLDEVIVRALAAAKQEGHREGSDLLQQLHRGKLGLVEFASTRERRSGS